MESVSPVPLVVPEMMLQSSTRPRVPMVMPTAAALSSVDSTVQPTTRASVTAETSMPVRWSATNTLSSLGRLPLLMRMAAPLETVLAVMLRS